jgi:hypothetical protein
VVGFAIALVFWPLGLRMAHVTFGQFAREVLARGLLPMAVAVGGGFLVRGMVLPSSWLGLAAQGLFCCLLYIITLGLFCLDRNERGFGAALLEMVRSHSSLGPKTLVARAHGGGICKCVGSLEILSFRSGNPRKKGLRLDRRWVCIGWYPALRT